jgi:hypothetical protein
MTRTMLRLLPVCLWLSVVVQGQSVKPLLGAGESVPIKRTSIGLSYNSQGFDRDRKAWVQEITPNYLRDIGAAHLLPLFQSQEIVQDAASLPRLIDESWAEISKKWQDCGGRFAEVVNRTSPESITVVIEPKAFWVPEHNTFANGLATDRLVRVAVIGTHYLGSNPRQANLVSLRALLKWEFGNLLECRLNRCRPIRIDEEIGDRSPCGR